jgi:hypothetical protein
MELFIYGVIRNIIVILGDDTNALVLYGSLIGTMVLLVSILVIYILTIGATAKISQAILRARFQKDVPLSQHRAFFGKAILSVIWLFALPVLFAVGFGLGANALFESGGDDIVAWHLWAAPIGGIVVFALLFVLLKGGKALKTLKKYQPVPTGN